MEAPLRSGVYVFPPASLVNVPVKTNNRAVLLARKTVARLMTDSIETNLFVPLPNWFAAFGGDRPPDLYLTQRMEFDALFSPTRAEAELETDAETPTDEFDSGGDDSPDSGTDL